MPAMPVFTLSLDPTIPMADEQFDQLSQTKPDVKFERTAAGDWIARSLGLSGIGDVLQCLKRSPEALSTMSRRSALIKTLVIGSRSRYGLTCHLRLSHNVCVAPMAGPCSEASSPG